MTLDNTRITKLVDTQVYQVANTQLGQITRTPVDVSVRFCSIVSLKYSNLRFIFKFYLPSYNSIAARQVDLRFLCVVEYSAVNLQLLTVVEDCRRRLLHDTIHFYALKKSSYTS